MTKEVQQTTCSHCTPPASRRVPRWAWFVLGCAVIACWVGSGFYFVGPDERGVERRFGRIISGPQGEAPGLHYVLPWPLGQADTPRTTEVRRAYVGWLPEQREAVQAGDVDAMLESANSDILTGDNNILKVTLVVQYAVSGPEAYLVDTVDPDELVVRTVQGVLVEQMAAQPVDEALTAAKAILANSIQEEAGQRLDEYGCGVRIVSVNFEALSPPPAVADAFKDVVSAKKDGERMVDQARGEANSILPRARGDAIRTTEEAEGYARSVVSRARGDADRFLQLLEEYRRLPEITATRLRLETFESFLPNVRVLVMENEPDGSASTVQLVEPAPM